ncbi:hypothetical protein CAPTEDRAFT_222574 [Capitella teleta]|uniref:Menorin-like domain-containing protein n=1 Tax=Capitella teleta TaxID=283909 RepID=R7THD7_CAPTE|nr:hypothetical protein CAPTEDRAFT_222574 [Capitella teleta]|eukprot:ELT90991.1 hypothetical protein CAPTEDRAFT_222574 [Capitella teleta]
MRVLGRIILLFISGVLFVLANRKFHPADSPLKFFEVDDGLHIKWYHGANSLSEMHEAIAGDHMMLEGDIILRWWGLPNQTEEPVMAHPPAVNSDNTLDNWLTQILNREDKGIKLDFKGLQVVRPSLELLKEKENLVNHPIWANADVVAGPGSSADPIDPKQFLSIVNEVWPNMTLSLGWTTGCCEPFTRQMMEDMLEVCHGVTQPVTFPARAASFRASWEHFKWLLEQNPESYTITVWTPSGAEDWEGTDIYDLLYVRNDCDKTLIYYDLPGEKFEQFKQLSVTAGSLVNYFPLSERDAVDVTWAHAVNSRQELEDVLNSDLMMLEADVLLRGQGTPNQTDIPVMAHPPATDSDITLEEWVERVLSHHSNKGIKLDFKGTDVLEPALRILQHHKNDFFQPILLNADILRGPNANLSTPVDQNEFKRIVGSYFPESIWSIGWTTGWTNTPLDRVYTAEMVSEMSDYAKQLKQPITYPVRAAMIRDSWDLFKNLLDESLSYTLTIWSGANDQVDVDDLVYVRQNYDIDRIYYDLPEPLMQEFMDKINKTIAL